MTFYQPPPDDVIELQLHLIFACYGEIEGAYQLSYGWSATGVKQGEATVNLNWRTSKALAVGVSMDPVHQAIEEAFMEINILDDSLQLYSDGRWNLKVSGMVNHHVTIGIEANGWNDTIPVCGRLRGS